MSREWKEVKLGDVLEFYNGKKRPKSEGIIPVYGGNGILEFCNDYNTEGQNIIIGRVGAYCGNVNHVNGRCWISDNAILSKAKNGFDSSFMYYSLINLNLNNHQIGSSQPLLTQGILKLLKINLPLLEEQKAITHILSTLDEKIETNNQINKTLEEMAQTIFKHWFVDFEFPNENGEPYKSSGGEMIESELGMIPKGWEIKELEDIAIITMGQSPKGSSYNEHGDGTVFYQGRTDFTNRFPVRRLYTTEPKRIAKSGNILMSVRAPVGDINIANEECCIGRGLCSFRSKSSMNSYLLYMLLSLKEKFDVFNGEGTVFGSINQKDLKGIKIIMPNDSIVKYFNDIAKSLDTKYLCLEWESRKSTNLRDLLLPKLMSGEIRVPLKGVDTI